MARLAAAPLGDVALARWAWAKCWRSLPAIPRRGAHATDLARHSGDDAALEAALATFLRSEPRGAKSRLARLKRVAVLERLGRPDDALQGLRDAVRFEPGHQEAWLLLSDRLASRNIHGESAWALEQGATATENDAQRAELGSAPPGSCARS